jgi:hypothetical protein
VRAGYARPVDVGVVIAGAGPVGLTLACELEHHGVEPPDRGRRRPRGRARSTPGAADPDAGPLLLHDGSRTSLRELLRSPELQLWICAGSGPTGDALALAERFAPALRAVVLVIADRPPAAAPGVDVVADPELRAHGRLGAVADTACVVRPDGHLGFRCEPPDAARLGQHLAVLGVSGV